MSTRTDKCKGVSGKGTMEKVSMIVGLIFESINDAHATHLMQPNKTLAMHEALGKYYDGGIRDMADGLFETTNGIYNCTGIKYDGGEDMDTKEVLPYFEELYECIGDVREGIKESWINNQIDTIQEEIAHTLFRLKRIVY